MSQQPPETRQSRTGRTVAVVAVVIFLTCVILGGSTIHEALVTGRTYSPAVVLGVTKVFYKSTSPIAYWSFMDFYLCSMAVCILLGISTLREVLKGKRAGGNSTRTDDIRQQWRRVKAILFPSKRPPKGPK